MKTRLVLLTALAAACATAQTIRTEVFHHEVKIGGPGPVGVEAMMGGAIKGQPYSADVISETVQVLADGNRISNKSGAFVARDSQGRTRHETRLNVMGVPGKPDLPKIVMIHDPQTQVTYTLEERSKAARKMSTAPMPGVHKERRVMTYAGNAGAVQFRTREGGKRAPEELGTKTIEGVMADGIRTTETIAAGEIGNEREFQIVNEVWTAQDLKAVVYSKRTDPRTGEMIYRLTNIQRSEPAASLFEVPADYKVEEGLPERIMMVKPKD